MKGEMKIIMSSGSVFYIIIIVISLQLTVNRHVLTKILDIFYFFFKKKWERESQKKVLRGTIKNRFLIKILIEKK